MQINSLLVMQGVGFLRRYVELDVEAKKPGADQALEWMTILENGLTQYQQHVRDMETRLAMAKQALG